MKHPLVVLLASTLLLPLSLACSSGLHGGDNILKFRHADQQPLVTTAPDTGHYVVAFRDHGSGDLWTAPDTRRKLHRGDDLGFARDDHGALIAIAADEQRTLGQLPVIAQYACWYRLPDDYDASRRTRKALRKTVGAAAVATVIGTAWVAEKSAEAYLAAHTNDDENVVPKWIARESHYRIR